jgi:formylglycine-generating enzyme required for sulfatase activity
LKAGLGGDLDLDAEAPTPDGWLTFTFRHRATGILLQLVPGGTFGRGLSAAEERALREELESAGDDDAGATLSFLESAGVARPAGPVRVRPFLLAPAYLDDGALQSLAGPDVGEGGLLPSCVTGAGAERVASALAAVGLRLPSEAEHEHAYRAGSAEPFPWGVTRPPSPRVHRNRFGFERMAEVSEVCADGWFPGYEGAPVDGSARAEGTRPRVARGGSAEVWPWQGIGEWVAMLSAFRSPASEHEGFLRIRPARSL